MHRECWRRGIFERGKVEQASAVAQSDDNDCSREWKSAAVKPVKVIILCSSRLQNSNTTFPITLLHHLNISRYHHHYEAIYCILGLLLQVSLEGISTLVVNDDHLELVSCQKLTSLSLLFYHIDNRCFALQCSIPSSVWQLNLNNYDSHSSTPSPTALEMPLPLLSTEHSATSKASQTNPDLQTVIQTSQVTHQTMAAQSRRFQLLELSVPTVEHLVRILASPAVNANVTRPDGSQTRPGVSLKAKRTLPTMIWALVLPTIWLITMELVATAIPLVPPIAPSFKLRWDQGAR